jgi:tyrocidine synthetase III
MKEIIKLILELADQQINIYLEDGKLKIDAPNGVVLDAVIPKIKLHRDEIIKYLSGTTHDRPVVSIGQATLSESYALSSSQRRLWILSQFEEGSIAYNIPVVLEFEGALDVHALSKSFDALVDRHEMLRTVFCERDGQVRQYVLINEKPGFRINHHDLRQSDEATIKQAVKASLSHPFDLANGPLLRANLYKSGDNKWIFSYVMHHIISDGWSTGILIKELLQLYNAFIQNLDSPLHPLRIHYKDYAVWQQEQFNQENFHQHRKYWLQQLSGELPVLDLPTDKSRPAIKTYNGASLHKQIDAAITAGFKVLCESSGCTLFMGLLATVNTLLYRYSNQEDIIIGSPIAGREHSDLEEQIGCYVNTLALRTPFSGTDSFQKLLARVKQITLDAYAHQAYPFDALIEELDLQRDLSRSALFDVLVVLQHGSNSSLVKKGLPGLQIRAYEVTQQGSKFDLQFSFVENGDQIGLYINYNTDLYHHDTIIRLLNHFRQLLAAIIATPEKPIGVLNYLSSSEQSLLLETFNTTNVPYSLDKTLIDLFEEQVERTPAKLAVAYQGKILTYAALKDISNQLAGYLQERYNIQAGDLIGIQQERSEWLVISLLAVLKSGGAYVPIDPAYPQDRIDYIIADSQCKVVLDEKELDQFRANAKKYSSENAAVAIQPADLAYIIYTSGSTGHPKGVMITHSNVYAFMDWCKQEFGASRYEVVLGATSICFDLSVFEIFYTLVSGKQLQLLKDALSIPEYLNSSAPLLINTVPSVVNSLLSTQADLSNVSVLNMAGEPIPAHTISQLDCDRIEVRNLYGPSEFTTYSTVYRIKNADSILIGHPISNTRIYILNDYNQLQPVGVVGEICISGAGLAKGYLHKEDLTTEKFIPHPFVAGERMYKTGDLGKWQPDGNIEFLGRNDDQVKIRAFRIELREISHSLQQYPGIKATVVTAIKELAGEHTLVAYVVCEGELNIAEIRNWLGSKLPHYMVPAYFLQLEAFPLLPNGKLNKKALPAPEGAASVADYVAPYNETEEKLISLWQKILNKERIGVTNNFFELGGHSLKAISVLSAIHAAFGISISIKTLFTHPVIRRLAEHIDAAITTRSIFERIPRVDLAPSYPVSNAQLRIWLESQTESGSIAYHIPFQVNLHGVHDLSCLKKAIVHVVDRHEMLRTVFRLDEDQELRQYILSIEGSDFEVGYNDFSEAQDALALASDYVTKDNHQLFDLEAGPLIRATILKCADDHYILYCNLHHIICDAWSVAILKKEVLTSYEAFRLNQQSSLPALNIQYKDYTVWYLQQLNNNAFLHQQIYWTSQLSGELPLLNFPTRQTRPPVKTYNGSTLRTYISADITRQLKAYAYKNNGSLFMVVLGTLHSLLNRYTGADDIIIGSPFAAREHIDLENQVGFYTNTLPVRNRLEAGDTFDSFFLKIRNTVLEAQDNQQYPFEQLVKDMCLKKDTSRNPLFDVMLVVNNQPDVESGHKPAEIDDIVAGSNRTSKFDLLVFVEEAGDLLSFRVEYNTDLFEAALIRQFIQHYKNIMVQLLANLTAPIASINYLFNNEGVVSGETPADYSDEGVITYFERQVSKTPGKMAVQYREQSFTYREINERANQLAHYLRKVHHVSPQTKVGVILDRSHFNVVAMLGVIKSGACYVPIDHKYQEQRIKYILNDASIGVIISETNLFDSGIVTTQDVIYLDAFDYRAWNNINPGRINVLDDPSFIIYTSGSTGNPKGVIQTHRMLNNLIQWNIYHSGIDTGLKHLQYCSFSFDVSLQDCWFVLSSGGTLFITPESMKTDFLSLMDYIIENGIEVLCFPFSALTGFFNDLAPGFIDKHQVKHIISSGEQLTVNKTLADFLHQNPGVKLHNHYGPSETHVVTSYTMSEDGEGIVSYAPIGKPLPNTFIYLLDKNLQPVPGKVIGEIYIGGENVAAGYLNLSELTAQRFIVSPFDKQQKLYKTGDLAYVDYAGNIIYLGRNDDQVKIRGYRIELAETKNALLAQEGITQAYVDVVKRNNELSLVAYIVASTDIDKRRLRKDLSALLPDYMVPAHMVLVDAIPLTPNGKINKKALPPIDESVLASAEYVAPHREAEKRLVVVWKKVLGVESVGITDDFFELGGHSLHITRMLYEINKVFDIKLPIKAVFASRTVQELAQVIEEEIIFKNGVATGTEDQFTNEKNSELWEI